MQDAEKSLPVVGIIPAAGRSGRMGTPKQLLHVDGKPMLLGIVDTLLGGGVARVTVVTNSAVREQLPSLPQNVDVVLNDNPKTQMIQSIRIGLTATPAADGYLVCPSDAARITAADVRRCLEAFAETPGHIVIATHDGRRGHPMIFPNTLARVVQSEECDAGLHQLSRNRPQLVREVICHSPGTVSNVNTPADYEKLK
jgi:CTP:molybdopterin cytidylyltransferase MocA